MANIIVQGKEYNNVPAVRLPAVGGGSATFYESGGGGVIAQPITITENGVYTAPEDTAYTPVTVQVPSSAPTLQSKTVNPTTSQQTVSPDSGYDGLSSVTVNAMPIGSATTPYTEIVENPVISVSSNGLIEAVVQHRESVTPTVVAGYVASGTAGDVDVDGYSTHQLSTQAGTTITPTESQQTAVASGKYTTGAVLVGAISSSYVGSGITRRDSTDLSASGDTVTVPSGYYANSASKAVSSGSATTPATTISPSVNIGVSNSGLITATAQDYEDITPTVVAGYVSSGTSGRVDVDAYDTYQLPTQSATTITPSTTSQTAVSAGKFTTGAITVDPIPSQYIVPTGTISITNNGTVDVTQYASADVDISSAFTNIISNSDFSDGTTGWSSMQPSQSSIAVSGGKLVLTHTTTSNRNYGVSYSVNTQAGHTYLIEYKLTKTLIDTDGDARGISVRFGGASNYQLIGMINGITQDQTITQMVAGTADSNLTSISITFLGNIATAASNDSMMEIWYCNMYDITGYLP